MSLSSENQFMVSFLVCKLRNSGNDVQKTFITCCVSSINFHFIFFFIFLFQVCTPVIIDDLWFIDGQKAYMTFAQFPLIQVQEVQLNLSIFRKPFFNQSIFGRS